MQINVETHTDDPARGEELVQTRRQNSAQRKRLVDLHPRHRVLTSLNICMCYITSTSVALLTLQTAASELSERGEN